MAVKSHAVSATVAIRMNSWKRDTPTTHFCRLCVPKKKNGVTDPFLVESILHPSKSIRKGFEQVAAITDSGLVVTGFRVKENAQQLILREPAGGKQIVIDKTELDEVLPSPKSAMPLGWRTNWQTVSNFWTWFAL